MASTTRATAGRAEATEIPAHIGPYEILDLLGAGGMGSVYRARRPDLDREVALKVINPALVADRRVRTRFLREAKALSLIHHPHVVALLDADLDGEIPFLALELISGRSLEAEIGFGLPAWPTARVRELARQVAGGLAAMHAVGVVHRDLKPSNVLCDSEGRFVLTDFGLAGGQVFTRVTAEGDMVGTPAYMAPECWGGGEISCPSDVFQLGVLLFEAWRSAPPFGRDLVEIARRAASGQIAAESFDDKDLGAVVVRCLQFEPAARPANGSAVLAMLEGRAPPPVVPRLAPSEAPRPDSPPGTNLAARPPVGPGPGLGATAVGFAVLALVSALVPGGTPSADPPARGLVVVPGPREALVAWKTEVPARTRAEASDAAGNVLIVEREGLPGTDHRLRIPWLGSGPQQVGPRLPSGEILTPAELELTATELGFENGVNAVLRLRTNLPCAVSLEAGGRVRAKRRELALVHELELSGLGPMEHWSEADLVLAAADGETRRVPIAGGLGGMVEYLEGELARLASRLPILAADPWAALARSQDQEDFHRLKPLLVEAFESATVGPAGRGRLYQALEPFERLDRTVAREPGARDPFGAADLAAPFVRGRWAGPEEEFATLERPLFEGSTGVGREGSAQGWLAEPEAAWRAGPAVVESLRTRLAEATRMPLPARPLEEIAIRLVIPAVKTGRLELAVGIDGLAPGTGLELEIDGKVRLRFLLDPLAGKAARVACWSIEAAALDPGPARVILRAVGLPGASGLPALVPLDLRARPG